MRLIFILTMILGLISCNRKDCITQFSEENKMDKQYYVYPSTLRMLNLEKNEEYNDMVREFKKGQYFSISNTPENLKLLKNLKNEMMNEGYEEAMTFQAKDQDFVIYVQENKTPKIAALIEMDSTLNIVQVEGLINIAKVPKLISNLNNSDYVNILEVLKIDQNRQYREHHPKDQ